MTPRYDGILTAVRIAVLPPWRIEDIADHRAVNGGSMVAVAVLYWIAKQYTPLGLDAFEYAGVVGLLETVFVFLVGLVIAYLDPTMKSDLLRNRWTTFLAVSFLYVLMFNIIVVALMPYVSRRLGFDESPAYWLVEHLGYRGATIALSVSAAVFATALLYARARRSFSNIIAYSPPLTVLYFVFATSINFIICFVLLYAV